MLLKVTGIVVAVLVIGFLGLIVLARIMERRNASRIFGKVDAVVRRVMGGESGQDELEHLAADPLTRNTLFARLESLGKVELFPEHYRSPEAFAESDMVFWLSHPNELGCSPAEIELAAKIRKDSLKKDDAQIFVFRFRVEESHWAASSGWMAGITGPYSADCITPLRSPCTFSELEPFDSRTPADHVDYLLSKIGSALVTQTSP